MNTTNPTTSREQAQRTADVAFLRAFANRDTDVFECEAIHRAATQLKRTPLVPPDPKYRFLGEAGDPQGGEASGSLDGGPDLLLPVDALGKPVRATPLYAERDIEALGEFYAAHVDAMTREGLHAKSDIAAELAWRDAEIDRLKGDIEQRHGHSEDAPDAACETCEELREAQQSPHECQPGGCPDCYFEDGDARDRADAAVSAETEVRLMLLCAVAAGFALAMMLFGACDALLRFPCETALAVTP